MAALEIPTATLANGVEVPQLGVGVFLVEPGVTEQIVSEALEVGYRHIDTAAAYFNEAEVGAAIAKSGIPRDEIFVTTKLWNTDHRTSADAFQRSLDALGLDHVDLYLVHWPLPMDGTAVTAWQGLVDIAESKRVRAIGVSNFEIDHLEAVIGATGVTPAVNQIEMHPLHQRSELRDFCISKGIVLEAWGPLAQGQGGLLERDAIVEAATAHGKSSAQVVLRWHLQRGTIVFPKTVRRERMVENAQLFDFELSAAEIAAIDALDEQQNFGPEPSTFDKK